MRDWLRRLMRFFFPAPGAPRWARVLPYAVLGILTFFVLVGGVYAWDYTNSPEFCGTSCHTMPPEYTSYLVSPHARVQCVECHIGRGFFATRFTRKAGDIRHIVSLAFRSYEFPIRADDLRPARDTCERCHFPEKFSDDSLREIRRFRDDMVNTRESIYLTLKTGGGSRRTGLGRGIHWHIENQVLYLSLGEGEQTIPYVLVVDEEGLATEYVDIEAGFNPETVNPDELKRMDCITCHNRITHLILPPAESMDLLLSRGLVPPSIPEIKRKGVEVLSRPYSTLEEGLQSIAGLANYYQVAHPDFYEQSSDLIDQAIAAIQETYAGSVFPEQLADWNTHSNNIGHTNSPGCFRCHDGKHLSQSGEAIRLECNLCHSIPVVAGPQDFVANIEISLGPEPESHFNSNWIVLHRDVFDSTCSNCHSVEDPGGTSNTSFCSNSACHGSVYEFAGFNAPALREILQAQLPPTPTAPPVVPAAEATYANTIGPMLVARCGSCHGDSALGGLNLSTYEGLLAGGLSGSALVSGDADGSLIIQVQEADAGHFAQLSSAELQTLRNWIEAGAPED